MTRLAPLVNARLTAGKNVAPLQVTNALGEWEHPGFGQVPRATEPRFGFDFSQVRVHDVPKVAEVNRGRLPRVSTNAPHATSGGPIVQASVPLALLQRELDGASQDMVKTLREARTCKLELESRKSMRLQQEKVVKRICDRLLRYGLHIEHYANVIIEGPWDSAPVGFKFRCKDRPAYLDALQRSRWFGLDPLKDRFNRIEYREIAPDASLHTWVDLPDKGHIHLDTVSIARGKDDLGRVIYKDSNLMPHIWVDLFHQKPVEVPEFSGGDKPEF